ncbi:MAG: Spermine synthase [Candidatus Woesebacteria bacterium GW2011_GWA2_40_7]|uniref:Spermine synthase n=3 Tax=Candidatus Woeseibacteriota TaxID=1752722 RepID=A0A0G0LLJ9_9BACT|nr:MAG: Spermine synthase [Candidatus Woesebacteria bacterium GW2011_GWB1_39_10]KKR73717.1 MAG: Spermine synthase [Candidatus Woesebacteria bacterium GW2011_GWA2_40_7]KKS90908.1 MAG: Spermine synthase [Candidatus Woesebacteria bacterium GW2011_GWA1_43_12]
MFLTKILEERKSKFNGDVRVVKTLGMGTYIQANGLTQSGGIVSTMWQSTLSKIRSTKSEIRNVLILGLGGGTVAKLIRKNWPQAEITGIDIDPIMVELGKKYLDLDKLGVQVTVRDASNLSNLPNHPNQKYDLIIVDLYNGDKFPKKFETDNYIHLVSSLLARSGVAVFNRLYYKEKKIEAEEFGKKLNKVFKNVESFRPVSNIMYICTN